MTGFAVKTAYPLYLKSVINTPADYNPPKGGKLALFWRKRKYEYYYISIRYINYGPFIFNAGWPGPECQNSYIRLRLKVWYGGVMVALVVAPGGFLVPIPLNL